MTKLLKILKFLGFLWALPVTCLGLLVLLACGTYKVKKWENGVLVVEPVWMWIWPKQILAVALGSLILVRDVKRFDDNTLLVHEQAHVYQCYVLGPFMLVLYPLASLIAWYFMGSLTRTIILN